MSQACTVYGWGTGPWGLLPWGLGSSYVPGGPLPTVDPFDVYCVGPCGPMSGVLLYLDVGVEGDSTYLSVTPENNLRFSAGPLGANPVWVLIDKAVPTQATWDVTLRFEALPLDFSDLPNHHVLLSITDSTGGAVALYVSGQGLAYGGGYYLDSFANLVVDGPVQVLEGSQTLVELHTYYTLRVVQDGVSGRVYIYWTKTSELSTTGHILRYVLPLVPSSGYNVLPPDRTALSARGTPTEPAIVDYNTFCLGTGALIPNLPPVADAGNDAATKLCTIVQLDGSRSIDPEGQAITFLWRLLDAPLNSSFRYSGSDGTTYQLTPHAPPAAYTNKFYSVELENLNALQAIAAGDVLVVAAEPFDILSTGTDLDGFYVLVDGYVLSDDWAQVPFTLMRQNVFSDRTAVRPTLLPDVVGFYKFSLVVSDGQLSSAPSLVVVSVLESVLARGISPSVSFLWDYLSDFYGQVENLRPRIETFWGSVAQAAAGMMLSLWQVEYERSLRDIPRQIARNWLNYDPAMNELLPEATAFDLVFSGILSHEVPVTGLNLSGKTVELTGTGGEDLFARTMQYTFTGVDPLTADDIAQQLGLWLATTDPRLHLERIENHVPPAAAASTRFRIAGPIPFALSDSATSGGADDGDHLWSVGSTNACLTGTGIQRLGPRVLKMPYSLQGVALDVGQLLWIREETFRIDRVVTDPGDPWPYQRLLLLDDVPDLWYDSNLNLLDISTLLWAIPDRVVSLRSDFYLGMVTGGDLAICEILDSATETLLEGECRVWGASSLQPAVMGLDLSPIAAFVAQSADGGDYRVYLQKTLRKSYLPLPALVSSIPYLQQTVGVPPDEALLRLNLDFYQTIFRQQPVLRFAHSEDGMSIWEGERPPDRLWAETTYLDNRSTIEANWGQAVGLRARDVAAVSTNIDYLAAVQGMYFVLYRGPTVENLRVGAQILLGLPFAEMAGKIQEIRTDFSTQQGRILVKDNNSELLRSYHYPQALGLETNPVTGLPYAVGDTVAQFAPLIKGVTVSDYVNNPTWFVPYVGQGVMTEVDKLFRFLVEVESEAFSLASLGLTQRLLQKLKPTYTTPMFVVSKLLAPNGLSVTDTVTTDVEMTLHDLAVSNGAYGMATIFDEADASPVPKATPADVTLPLQFTHGLLDTVVASGQLFGGTYVTKRPGTLSAMQLVVAGSPGLSDNRYTLVLLDGTTELLAVDFTWTTTPVQTIPLPGSIALSEGAKVRAELRPKPATVRYPSITSLTVTADFTYTPLPASFGHGQSQFDQSSDPAVGEVGPTDIHQVLWGYDRPALHPRMGAYAAITYVAPAPFTPAYDLGVFAFDSAVFDSVLLTFYDHFMLHVPPTVGQPLFPATQDAGATLAVNTVELRLYGGRQDAHQSYELVISINGIDQAPLALPTFTASNTLWYTVQYAVSYSINLGDTVSVRVQHSNPKMTRPWFEKITVTLGTAVAWTFDDTLPAGTYESVRLALWQTQQVFTPQPRKTASSYFRD